MRPSSPIINTVVCVGDNVVWIERLRAQSESPSSEPCTFVSWEAFDASPMALAHPQRMAIAHIDDLSKPLAIRLGNLCRSFPSGVDVELSADVCVSDEQFFAHGFQKPTEQIYRYRLEFYKVVPDWLNARYWAHPERFDR